MVLRHWIFAIVLSLAVGAQQALAEFETKADFRTGLSEHWVTIGKADRQFYLYVPKNDRRKARQPLIIGFHGGGGTALGFGKRTGLRRLADAYGAVIALPQGLGGPGARGGTWNVESPSPVGFADRTDTQDLAFLDAMIRYISAGQAIAPSAVYATGLSQGGMMALRLACERPGLLAAVAPVAGTLASGECANPGRTDVLHIHGSADQNVPMEGGRGRYSNRAADWTPVQVSLDTMFRTGTCGLNVRKIVAAKDTQCTLSGCSSGHHRQLCVVDNGGHGWPGIAPLAWQRKRDQYISPHFDATAYIGRFFFGR